MRPGTSELIGTGTRVSGARTLLSRGQKVGLIVALIVLAGAIAVKPHTSAVVLISVCILGYLGIGFYKARLVYDAWRHQDEGPQVLPVIADADLPRYTVLVPLYQEGGVVPHLVRHLGQLDYPVDRHEILLLCEADDTETIAVIDQADLPPQFRLVVCPDGSPKTKPRACNIGLTQSTGDLVVIYDAEDRPDLDQLRRAAELFAISLPEVMCLQARLDYHNHRHNLLTRFFTVEYNFWFDLLLPALAERDMPIPLGGTSNHFRAEDLIALGGWDPYNVTEDADLGCRLFIDGKRTRMLDSVTLEEACSQTRAWVRQRSRWLKGYMQTWCVHARNNQVRKAGGLRAWLGFHFLIGGTPLVNLLNPFFLALTVYFLLTRAHWVLSLFPRPLLYASVITFTLGNFLFIYVNFLAVERRERWHLVWAALLAPLYWLLGSLGTYKAFGQLITGRLHKWEKTPHGLSGESTDPAAIAAAAEDDRRLESASV